MVEEVVEAGPMRWREGHSIARTRKIVIVILRRLVDRDQCLTDRVKAMMIVGDLWCENDGSLGRPRTIKDPI